MKRYILPVLFGCFAVGAVHAQTVKKERTSFNYTRMPLTPLDKSIDGYKPAVAFVYEEEVNRQKQAFLDAIMDSINLYQQNLNSHHRANIRSSNAPNLLMTGKPKAPGLSSFAYIPKLYNADEFASAYVKLSGYENGGSNPVDVTVLLKGFEHQAPVLQSKKRLGKDANGNSVTFIDYYYDIKYRVPMSVKLENDGEVIEEKELVRYNSYSVAKTIRFPSTTALADYWSVYESSFLADLDEKAVRSSMGSVQDALDNWYGFKRVTRGTEIFTVKPKKFQYPEHEEGYVAAIAGYNKIANAGTKKEGIASLKKAIEWWQKALKESRPNDKKARINGKVTAATHVNIAEAAIFAEDYATAETHISKAKLMKYNKYEREANALKSLLEDQKKRYMANNQ